MLIPTRIVRVEFASKTFVEWSEDAEGRRISAKVCGAFGPDAADYGPPIIDHQFNTTTASELKEIERSSKNPGGQVAHHYPYTVSYRPFEGSCPADGIAPVYGDRGCECWPCILKWEPGKLGEEPANPELRGMVSARIMVDEFGNGLVCVLGDEWPVPGGQHAFPDRLELTNRTRELADAVLCRANWERVRDWVEEETDAGKELTTYVRRMHGIAMERPVHLNSY